MQNIYSHLKPFHFHEKLDSLKNRTITPPLHIRLKPINACNHRCFYCCYRHDSLFLGENMNEKDMIPETKINEIAVDMIKCGIKAVTFTGGGEPLIYPYIQNVLSTLLNGGIKVAVLTNGVRLSGNTARILAQGASWVRISIDSTNGEMLATTRNTSRDDFDLIVKNIERFAQIKQADCELGINFIITEHNAESVYSFIKMMKHAGADHVKVSECIVSTKGAENKSYHEKHFQSVLKEVKRAEENLNDDGFRVVNKFHDFDDKFDKKYTFCPFIQFLNVIAADLRVYACQDKAYTSTGILGDLSEQSLQTLWESDAYKERIQNLNPKLICNHHCVSHGKNLALHDYLTTDLRHIEFV
jgi:MoaA/NifB/PqqE/SkfB family radical SAM enzyme